MADRGIRLKEIEAELKKLPEGNVTYKNIRGAKRMYFCGKYVKAADEADVILQVSKRKRLEAEKEMLLAGDGYVEVSQKSVPFETNVITGEALVRATSGILDFGYRKCSLLLNRYLNSESKGRVCILYGLRRTGKTTMVLQEISNLPMSQTAYIKILTSNDMAQLNRDIKRLADLDYKYIFIDEVTLMKDFIDSASLLSDVYAIQGIKIVLSGTDSLGFAISTREELYDRAITIHTTFIPFKEYASLLNINDVDEYIRYGGTFRMGDNSFCDEQLSDESISFIDDESTRRYIDTAIAKNIQHSLACHQDGGHFRHLISLYEADELTGAINRIIEDMNHRFLLSVITRDFVSHDLGSARQISRKRAATIGKFSMLDAINISEITCRLMELLEIKNAADRKIDLTNDHVTEIKEYLKMLDLIVECPAEGIGTEAPVENVIFSQPGMRYCQAQALVYSLMQDETFNTFSAIERNEICDLILEEVRGRMLEEIVLLETMKALPYGQRAFKLVFEVGEIDMVVENQLKQTCELYEIKHTTQIDKRQYRHLIDSEKIRKIEHKYGSIISRTVLYRGDEDYIDGIRYKNVEEYLKEL